MRFLDWFLLLFIFAFTIPRSVEAQNQAEQREGKRNNKVLAEEIDGDLQGGEKWATNERKEDLGQIIQLYKIGPLPE
ncbi:hypothetical protein F2Q70_00042779 [Brassica cretica]|uniref:Uncharacterized protein n=1 Tax=Brassica cretica TaxID=69181 RepID=A0A8S9KG89_BRACR|nr:hypothetical protein F2Q70_00042779 [Brassica cretica]